MVLWLSAFTMAQETVNLEDIVLSDELEDDGTQYTGQKEFIDDLLEDPININTADREELAQLYFLNEFQVRSLIDYRRQYGAFQSIYELNYVFGFDRGLIQQLSPFIKLGDDVTIQTVSNIHRNSHELLMRYKIQTETPIGYTQPDGGSGTNYYTGSKPKQLIRYKFEPNKHVRVGLRGEKDAGEAFFKGSNRHGFDHYSGFIEISDVGKFKQICIGDYGLNIGQGLAFRTSQFFHSGYAETVVNRYAPLRATTSADENRFLRGIAMRYQYKNIEFVPFVSRKKTDANVLDTLNDNTFVFSSLQITGLHATPGEIYDEKSVSETIFGMYSSYSMERFKIGLGAFQLNRAGIYLPTRDIPQYKLQPTFKNLSLDLKLTTGKVLWFGEVSQSINSLSWLGGMHIFPSSNLYFTFLVRDYNEPEKHNYRYPFSIGSNIYFQQGAFLGVTIKPLQQLTLRAYHDRYISHQPEYLLNMRQQKSYSFGEVNYQANDLITVRTRIKYREQEASRTHPDHIITTSGTEKSTIYQFNFYYQITQFRYHFQLSHKQFKGANAKTGQLAGNHVVYRPENVPFLIKTGQFIYQSDDYDSRLYAYEPDVLYAFSIPAFYGQGLAWYALVKFNPLNRMDVWLKYSRDSRPYATSMGSGLNEVPENHRSYITAQIRWKF
jgi:hypothetical protein